MRIAAVAARLRQQQVKRASLGRGKIEPHDGCVRQAFFKRWQNLRKSLLEHQHLYPGIRQNEQLLGHCKTPVQRHQHRAEPCAGIKQHQIVRPVQAEDCDAIAAADTQFSLQRACRLVDACTQARVTQSLALKYNRGLVRRERRVALDQTAEVHSYSSASPVSYSASRPMRSRQSSAVHGSISEPQRLSR